MNIGSLCLNLNSLSISYGVYDLQLARVVTTLQGHKDLVNCVEWIPKHLIEHSSNIQLFSLLLSIPMFIVANSW